MIVVVLVAALFLVAPGVMMIRDEFHLRTLRRGADVVIPLDRTTLALAVLMLAAGVAVITTTVVER